MKINTRLKLSCLFICTTPTPAQHFNYYGSPPPQQHKEEQGQGQGKKGRASNHGGEMKRPHPGAIVATSPPLPPSPSAHKDGRVGPISRGEKGWGEEDEGEPRHHPGAILSPAPPRSALPAAYENGGWGQLHEISAGVTGKLPVSKQRQVKRLWNKADYVLYKVFKRDETVKILHEHTKEYKE